MKKVIKWIVPLVVAILALIGLGFMVLGLLIGLVGYSISGISCAFIGLVITASALIFLAAGFTYFDPAKFEAGVLTRYGKVIIIDDKTITVKGVNFFADYFPFYFGAIRVNMQKKKWAIKKQVLSVEKEKDQEGKSVQIPLDGEINLTVMPDPNHMDLYLQSGGDLAKIEEIISPMVYRETQRKITYHENEDGSMGMDMMTICLKGDILDKSLTEHVNGTTAGTPGLFEQKGSGVKCDGVNVDFPLPLEVTKSLRGIPSVKYDNLSRSLEYAADATAAKDFMTTMNAGVPEKNHIIPIEASNKTMQFRMLRDGKLQGVQNEQIGGGGGGKGGKGRPPREIEVIPIGGGQK